MILHLESEQNNKTVFVKFFNVPHSSRSAAGSSPGMLKRLKSWLKRQTHRNGWNIPLSACESEANFSPSLEEEVEEEEEEGSRFQLSALHSSLAAPQLNTRSSGSVPPDSPSHRTWLRLGSAHTPDSESGIKTGFILWSRLWCGNAGRCSPWNVDVIWERPSCY